MLAGPTAEKTEYQDVFMELKRPRGVFDFADEMIESGDPGREALAMTFRRNVGVGEKYIRLKEMYQCPFCGRMIIEDNSGDFCFFAPEEHNEKNLLDYGAECEKKHI